MKKVEAIIRRAKLAELKKELTTLGIQGITVLEAGGFGQQRGHPQPPEEGGDEVYLVPKYKLEIFTTDAMAGKVVEKIAQICKTGRPGDGKVFVANIDSALRIRTGESGEQAL